MAFNSGNADRPNGLTPIRHLTGGVIRASEYGIAYNYATALYSGDLVKSSGSGSNVVVSGVTDTSIGVFAGCSYSDDNGDIQFRPYWPGVALSADRPVTAYVFDDPDLVFEIQANATVAAADVGQNFDTASGGGSAVTGRSADELDKSGTGAAATGQLRLIRFVDREDNVTTAANAKCEVIISEHEFASTRPGV